MTKNAEVGYGKPPVKSQFKKGKSGNPYGRPKKPATVADPNQMVIGVLNEPVSVKNGNKFKKIPVCEALLRCLVQQAMGGKAWALKELMKVYREVPAQLYRDIEGFRHNSESQKLIETFLEKAEAYQNGDIKAFMPQADTD